MTDKTSTASAFIAAVFGVMLIGMFVVAGAARAAEPTTLRVAIPGAAHSRRRQKSMPNGAAIFAA